MKILLSKQRLSFAILFISLLTFNNLSAQCTADFSVIQGASGSVTFSNTSTGTSTQTTYYYTFGDNSGSGVNSTGNSTHTYTTDMIYAVTLYLNDSLNSCFTTATKTIAISNVGCNLTLQINNVNSANVVNFSTSVYGYSVICAWNFGDNTTGYGFNPVHTYSTPGVYNVILNVTLPFTACSYSVAKTVPVNFVPCALTAGYTYSNTGSGNVNFTNTCTGTTTATSYQWNIVGPFGSNQGTYNTPNISHTFPINGSYTVVLSVSDSSSASYCTAQYLQSFTVSNAVCLNLTSFTLLKDFTQNLTWNAYPIYPANITNVSWDFGDGGTSNQYYPTHIFSAAAAYNVCLSATVSCGTNTTTCISSNIYKPAAGGTGAEMISLQVLDPKTVGLNKLKGNGQIKIFPNPASTFINVQIDGKGNEEFTLTIVDVTGKIAASHKITPTDNATQQIDVSGLPEGLYLLQLNGDNLLQTQKVLIQK